MLNSLKIDVPAVTALAAGLYERGFNVDPGIIDEKELTDAVCAEYFGRKQK